jgi:methionine salvage enolase-phosphatase E1
MACTSCWPLQVSIYSSGSREAQALLFGNTEVGDLRKYLSCYFDTTTGGKRQAESYEQIVLSLGKALRSPLGGLWLIRTDWRSYWRGMP